MKKSSTRSSSRQTPDESSSRTTTTPPRYPIGTSPLRLMRAAVYPASVKGTTPRPLVDATMLLADLQSLAGVELADDVGDQIEFARMVLLFAEDWLASLDEHFPGALEGARLIEAIRLATVDRNPLAEQRVTTKTIARLCSGTASRLRALGPGKKTGSDILGAKDASRRAEVLRNRFAQYIAEKKDASASDLAGMLDFFVSMTKAESVIPRPTRWGDPKRLQRWTTAIQDEQFRVGDIDSTALATCLVTRICRVEKVPKPNRFFDRERKALKRSR